MSDGMRLPLRIWRPEAPPQAVILALHGFNDSRDAWEIPAPDFVAAGMMLYAPDQRGFGATATRGRWPGGKALTDDAAEMVALLRERHPGVRLILMGESMGAAVLLRLAVRPDAPDAAGYVLSAPAFWLRARLPLLLRVGLRLAMLLLPGSVVSRTRASDNRDALLRIKRNPLTLRTARFSTLLGLRNLMLAASAAAAQFTAPALFQYGAHDSRVRAAATAAAWRRLPPGPHRLAYYPNGWHLLMRGLDRAAPIGDAIAWIRDPSAHLPSGAEASARQWLDSAVE